MDCYKILNVDDTATLKEIEQAYKDLISFYNPENNVSKNAYKKYREVNEAYKILSEIKQKEMYDRLHVKSVEEETKQSPGARIDSLSYRTNKMNARVNNYLLDKEVTPLVSEVIVDVDLSYLYYLTNSDYKITYNKDVLIFKEEKCSVCLGVGMVKKNNKIVTCPHCLGHKKECIREKEERSITINVNDNTLAIEEDDHKVIVNFNFYDKEFFRVNNNEIFIDYVVSDKEYSEGVNFNLVRGDITCNIDSLNFKNSIYTFLDKIIHVNYILKNHKGRDIEAYLLTDLDVIYLNLNDFTYKSSVDKTHTYKLNINSSFLVLEGLGEKGYNDKNGNLNIKVIRVKNVKDEYLFFDRKIKKVSANLFKFKGKYNNHMFISNSKYDYDEEYIYLPSKAYKLKSKSYLVFKIIYSLLYLIIPLILYFIMGFSLAYCIVVGIFFIVYLVLANLFMEVKI